MKMFFGKYCKKYMLRPILYKLFTKLVVSVVVMTLWIRFVDLGGLRPSRVFAGSALAAIFGASAWLSFLRLDGVKLPRLPSRKALTRIPKQSTADLTDHLDTQPESFDELLQDERDFAAFASSLILFVVFLIVGIV